MFHRFASALFGDDMEEQSQSSGPGGGDEKEQEEDEDWILVNYLTETCSAQCGDGLSGSTVCPEEEGGPLMSPSPVDSLHARYASCTSLDSTTDTDPDGGPEDDDESGFLRVDASSLEESWFVTPPPCFTGCDTQPVLLETSPLENLLIEHPSMSVYAHHSLHRLPLNPLELGLLAENVPTVPTASSGKEKARRMLDSPRHSPTVIYKVNRNGGRAESSNGRKEIKNTPVTGFYTSKRPLSAALASTRRSLLCPALTSPNAPNRCPAMLCAASTFCGPRRPAPCTCTSPPRDSSTSEAS
ncbi:tumor protein p53-inducible nuclear protein 1 isoform X1 [Betta splendens]|uniref:Tumor protein p53-inducible nuclear protein 1 isoform X1 n=1 Tax=Betta splendens TaxID=158456 RepID=A0A9W2XBC3_BETSP|nr:tumor protein p53-inducible nuclear protein 1 isoform X1 [Betta splendens]